VLTRAVTMPITKTGIEPPLRSLFAQKTRTDRILMELTLALMTNDATTRILGVLGFLLLLPLVIFAISLVGRRVVEKGHAEEFASEVSPTSDADWLQRTTGGGSRAE
jgi:hypothetical protein